jgi:hypothetical protein
MTPMGLHKKPFGIRPESQVIEAPKSISSKVTSRKIRNGQNGKSVIGL